MARYFATLRAARDALALDYGFNPFLPPRSIRARPTKATMARLGYVVDAVAASQARAEAERADAERKAEETARRAAEAVSDACRAERSADLAIMQRVAAEVSATGAPVARMEMYGRRDDGVVRITYRDGRKPTLHAV